MKNSRITIFISNSDEPESEKNITQDAKIEIYFTDHRSGYIAKFTLQSRVASQETTTRLIMLICPSDIYAPPSYGF